MLVIGVGSGPALGGVAADLAAIRVEPAEGCGPG
jgi:hypothetical protein